MKDDTRWARYRVYFCVLTAIATIGYVGYLLYGSADVQPWNSFKEIGDVDNPIPCSDEKTPLLFRKSEISPLSI